MLWYSSFRGNAGASSSGVSEQDKKNPKTELPQENPKAETEKENPKTETGKSG